MCPECIATAAQIAAGAGSASGFVAYIVKHFRARLSANEFSPISFIRRNHHDRKQRPNAENRFETCRGSI
jgi:hypothetical protein